MKRLAGAVLLLGCGCIDFEAARLAYCRSITPRERAVICEDGPRHQALLPDKSATNVKVDTEITVHLNQDVTCTGEGLRLVHNTQEQTPVPGKASCQTNIARFTPAAALQLSRVYRVFLTEAVVNGEGTPVIEYTWTFTTTNVQ